MGMRMSSDKGEYGNPRMPMLAASLVVNYNNVRERQRIIVWYKRGSNVDRCLFDLLLWLGFDIIRELPLEDTVSSQDPHEKMGTYQAFEEPFPGSGAAGHHIPDLVLQLGKTELLLNFRRAHRCPKVSFTEGSPGCPDCCLPPGMSCLLANTSRSASFISRSRMIR